jgi:hypothetical protein
MQHEDTPQDLPLEQSLNPVSGENQAQTDLTAQNLGEAVVDEVVQPTQDTLVHDVEKAHFMALNSDTDRSLAAMARREKNDYSEGSHLHTAVQQSAERYDRAAERYEEWAAILHDKPVSEEYKAAHPDFSFSAGSLVRTDELFKHRINDAEVTKLWAETVSAPQKLGEFVSLLHEFSSHSDKSTRTEIEEMINNPDTTMGELKEKLRAIADQRVDAANARAAELEGVLDDVRSGRASEATPIDPAEAES